MFSMSFVAVYLPAIIRLPARKLKVFANVLRELYRRALFGVLVSILLCCVLQIFASMFSKQRGA